LAFLLPGTGSPTGEIWTYDWERDTASKLTSTPGVNEGPVWTPDSKGIVYGSRSGDANHLFWIRSDGASTAVPLTESKVPQSAYSFSPGGQHLLYVDESVDTSADIWSVPIDWSDSAHPKAGKPEVFLQTKAIETQPAFSTDGRWVAYASGQGRNQEVYVRPFPANPSAGQWQISSGGGANPIWSHSGSEFFYQAPEGIMVVSYTAKGSAFLPGKPRLWSNRRLIPQGIGTMSSRRMAASLCSWEHKRSVTRTLM
jgi:Tol biopolymer transport system component